MATRVSVIIPCFNAARWIRETLESVAAQICDADEVIVVDDGSTDESAEIIRRGFPFVHLIQTPNRGASAARNTGMAEARGEFIQYLDADDLLARGKIATQIAALEQTGADVAYGDWAQLIRGKQGEFFAGRIVKRRLAGLPELELFGDFWCPPAVYLFRRRIVESVGKWNEGLPIIQDARFVLDCALHGGTFTYCPGIMGFYREHEDSLSRRDPIAFCRDLYRNVREVECWWQSHGGLTPARLEAVIHQYEQVARSSYERDRALFNQAFDELGRLRPGYLPSTPRHFAVAARILGYRNAEAIGAVYRRLKRLLLRGKR